MIRAEGLRTVTIPARFNGPPDSGNGGYVSGRIAAFLPAADDVHWPEITLRAPTPLDTALTVGMHEDGTVPVTHGDTLVCLGRMATANLHTPAAPRLEQALSGRRHFRCWDAHPLPTCFVCGTARAEGDGLRVFTGPFEGHTDFMVAAPWTPHASMAGPDGLITDDILWGALDCPGAFAVDEATASGLKLLGRLSARIHRRPEPGTPLIVAGWYLGSEGRKHGAGTAVFDTDGALLAEAKALWIELRAG
ncbi:MAG: hypothetical protein ACFB6R_13015 [Alphaproteobacteria bacterium]